MRYMWKIDLKTLEEFYEFLAEVEKETGRKLTKEESELIFLKFMKAKGKTYDGATELNNAELYNELIKDVESFVHFTKDGQTRLIKRKKNE